MNQTEAAYATLLDARKLAGEVLGWFFQPFPLQLAPHTLYHFDFLVCEPTKVCIVEIKGFLRDDASVKFRVAAHMFQAYEFLMLRKKSEAFVKVRGMYFPVPRSAR